MGPNYYDEVLANYASYLRSGLNLFLNNARAIGDYWSSMPELDQGYALGTPRHQGVTGLIAGAVLDGRTNNWYAIRNIAKVAVASSFSVGAILSPCSSDTREQAYGQSWLALLAMFDPDSAQKAYWQSQLPAAYARDNGCITGGVFQQPFYDGLSGAFTFSGKTATSTSIPASLCPTVASGSIGPLSPGNTTASGTGFIPQPSGKIVIKTTRNGSPYLFYSLFTYNSTTSITLATPFDGDAGTYSYQIESDQKFLSFSADLTDYANLNNFYSCTWVNGTTITLDRAWAGGSGTFNATRQPSTYVGYGWTPYQNGIKALATHYASLGATGTTAANYAQLANSVATSILTSGFDPVTKGLYYARNFYNCEPPGIYKIGCSYGPDSYSQQAARTLSGEAQNAMSMAYQANQTPAAKTFGDQFYGAQWGAPGFGNPPYSDGIYIQPATWNYKWYGFLFGIGMSHQWPAVRLGGVSPTQMRTVNIPFVLSMVANAAKVQITLTQPTGAISSPIVCTTSPCALTVDARVGSPLMKLDYLNSSGAVIAPGDPIPLYLLN